MAAPNPPPRSAWVLLALHAAEGHSLTPVQLQKCLFLLGSRRPKDVGRDFYHFRPYDYGPFDVMVYTDSDQLVERGMVTIDKSMGQSLRRFVLTADGNAEAERLVHLVPPRGMAYLREVVAWAQRLSFNELVAAVYEAYPEMRANSVFRD